jgi:UDP-N-acetylmuramate--alanine ligase
MSSLALVGKGPEVQVRPRRSSYGAAAGDRHPAASATTPATDADVVVSTAVPEDNPELVRARERGQRVIHRGELLAELCSQRRLLAIAGTHGKTTTAAMCIWALRKTGAEPAFFLGGELPGAGPDGEPSNAGWGEEVIAEAESDASFLKPSPRSP